MSSRKYKNKERIDIGNNPSNMQIQHNPNSITPTFYEIECPVKRINIKSK